MIVVLHHIALSVPDLDDAVAFSTDHLGLTEAAPVQLETSAAICRRDPFGTIIELYELGGPHGLESTGSPS